MSGTPSPSAPNPPVTPTDQPGTRTPGGADQVIDAAQAALAGEHAGIYGYGVVGAYLSGDAQEAARRDRAAHERLRGALRRHLLALDADPVAARPGYTLPFTVDDDASARELAGVLEERLAGLYVDLVGSGPEPDLRELAAESLVANAVRRARWTGETTPFPGLDGRL